MVIVGSEFAGFVHKYLVSAISTAGKMAGAMPAASLMLPLLLRHRGNRDPIIEVTVAIVVKHSSFIWDSRVSMSKLQGAWTAANDQMGNSPT